MGHMSQADKSPGTVGQVKNSGASAPPGTWDIRFNRNGTVSSGTDQKVWRADEGHLSLLTITLCIDVLKSMRIIPKPTKEPVEGEVVDVIEISDSESDDDLDLLKAQVRHTVPESLLS